MILKHINNILYAALVMMCFWSAGYRVEAKQYGMAGLWVGIAMVNMAYLIAGKIKEKEIVED